MTVLICTSKRHAAELALGSLRLATVVRVCGFMAFLLFANVVLAQNSSPSPIQDHLDSGEIPRAIEIASTLKRGDRDHWLAQIAEVQMGAGAPVGAFETASMIGYDSTRTNAMNALSNFRRGNHGAGGGVTEADFQPLIDLIQNTIQPDTWQDTGQGLGTLNPYPAGVYVDASGTLKKIKRSKVKGSSEFRAQSQIDSGNRESTLPSDLRKISLTRLEQAAQRLAAQGKPLDPTMQNLAGLYEIRYLMMFPETGDIVIAGPAGPWELDEDRRPINAATGKPVLQLDDLVVCLRNAWENNGQFGCSINPRKQNLVSTKQFLASTDLKGKRWAEGIREALGQQDIEVTGISPDTHAARVLVESDYRMKLLGMGLEPSIPAVPSYLDRIQLNPDGVLPPMDVVRWWFTLNYDDIMADQDQRTFTFHGSGVKVLSENEFINEQGDRIHTGQSDGPTAGFARDFTQHFDALADKYPVYRQLKNVFDLALVANLIREQDLAGQTQWHRTFFGASDDQTAGQLTYQVKRGPNATQVDSVLNDRILKVRKNRSTIKHHIVGVSGGIAYNAQEIIGTGIKPDAEGKLTKAAEDARPEADESAWWWD